MKLKPFDLKAAKAGKPVCDRLGRRQRILAFDLASETYPIAATVTTPRGEGVGTFTVKGRAFDTENSHEASLRDENLYMEGEWYEDIPKSGVLCWVSDTESNPCEGCDSTIINVYRDGMFITESTHSPWMYAKPLTPSEVEELLETSKDIYK